MLVLWLGLLFPPAWGGPGPGLALSMLVPSRPLLPRRGHTVSAFADMGLGTPPPPLQSRT